MTGRDRVLDHLAGKPVDCLPCLPITMQFAADRIGAAYREYATNYKVLVEGQIQTAQEFGFDYVNTMSDPACEAADCGAPVVFYPNAPASLDDNNPLLADRATLNTLTIPDPTRPGSRMHNRLLALALHRERVGGNLLIEGWIEGPVAEAADLRGMHNLMLDFYDDPSFVRRLFDFALEMEINFAKAQVDAGAEQIGIGDAAASLVGPRIYEEFVWPYEKKMVDAVRALGVPARLHICGNTRKILDGMGRLNCDIVDLDYLSPMAEGRAAMGMEQVLLGNIDPVRVLRNGTPDDVYNALAECHRTVGDRYIVGAGCEVPRDTPHENLRALVRYARDHAPGNGMVK